MEFKHIAFIAALICSAWALFVGGMTKIEDLGNIEFKSEIPAEIAEAPGTSNFEAAPIENKFESIIDVFNLGLPIALICIILLGLTYKSNPIGFFPLIFIGVLFLFAATKALDAAHLIEAQSDFSIDSRVWWM